MRAGLLLTVAFVAVGLVGATVLLAPGLHHLWLDQRLADALRPPGSPGHPLGTDAFGRDLLWRTVAGIGLSLLIGLGLTVVVLLAGLGLGAVAGYFGGRRDTVIGGAIDLAWCFPLVLVAVSMAVVTGPGIVAAVAAIAATAWAGFARVVRAEVRSVREREFVDAARLLGVPERRILLSHVVPSIAGTTLVLASHAMAISVITEASLSFIGLGAQPPTPSLGQMVAEGRTSWSLSPWPALVPGIAIAAIVVGLSALGDGLRDLAAPTRRDRAARRAA